MATVTVRFSISPVPPAGYVPTLGYAVSYKRIGVDPSPTFLSSNSVSASDVNGNVSIDVQNLVEGYEYEITVQPKCGIDNVGTLLVFTKKVAKSFQLYRDPSTSAGACAAANANTSPVILWAVAPAINNQTVLYQAYNIGDGAQIADSGWYANKSGKAFNLSAEGIVINNVNCG